MFGCQTSTRITQWNDFLYRQGNDKTIRIASKRSKQTNRKKERRKEEKKQTFSTCISSSMQSFNITCFKAKAAETILL